MLFTKFIVRTPKLPFIAMELFTEVLLTNELNQIDKSVTIVMKMIYSKMSVFSRQVCT